MLLAEHAPALAALRLVLASGSPRRSELLREQLGLAHFEVLPSRFAEDLDKAAFATPAEYCAETARRKGDEVLRRCCCAEAAAGAERRAQLVISADTVVCLDGAALEKPRDAADAAATLRRLSGRPHEVVTAVALALLPAGEREPGAARTRAFRETTRVRFAELSDAAIDAYVACGEPMDKAGSYGIQGRGAPLVAALDGCYFNVVGLPLHRLSVELGALLAEARAAGGS